jgi:surface antigen
MQLKSTAIREPAQHLLLKGIWMLKPLAAALLAALFVTACLPRGDGRSTIAGANPGIVVGSPVASGVGEAQLGAVEGGLLGADVGLSLTERDREAALKAEYEALEYGSPGQPTRWQGNRSGNQGEVSVGASYEVNRLDCREYTHRISIGGRPRVVRATACRQPDGVWRVVG